MYCVPKNALDFEFLIFGYFDQKLGFFITQMVLVGYFLYSQQRELSVF